MKYVITFIVSTVICVVTSIVLLSTFVPQVNYDINLEIPEYEGIKSNEFKFEKTKDIEKTNLEKQYIITSEELNKFIKGNQYKPGNSNPFTPAADVGSSGGNQGNANDNTSNGNGGNANPPSTGK